MARDVLGSLIPNVTEEPAGKLTGNVAGIIVGNTVESAVSGQTGTRK